MHRTVATILAASLFASSADAQAAAYSIPRPSLRLLAPAAGPAASGSVAADAPAVETESFDTLVSQATARFKEKDYAGAVSLFDRAYALQPEPAILFNIGRIYEQAQNPEAAIAYYEKFIADSSVDLADREKAATRLQVLRTIVEATNKAKKPAPAPASEPKPVAEPKPVNAQPVDTPPDQKPAQPGRLLRPIGYAMVGTGAALLIGGAITGGLARGQHNAFTEAESLEDRQAAAQRGKSLATTADGLFIAGGVVAAVGIVLLIVPAVRKSRAAQALAPAVSPTHVGLGFTHRF